MDDDATLKQLYEIRNALLRELKEVEALISQFQGVKARLKRLSPSSDVRSQSLLLRLEGRPRNLVTPAEIANRVEGILREAGRPMTRSELATKLMEEGIPLVGSDISKNVGTILWRHKDRFVNLKRLGYWLRNVPLVGVYDPVLSD